MRIQSSCTICSQISGLSFDAGCRQKQRPQVHLAIRDDFDVDCGLMKCDGWGLESSNYTVLSTTPTPHPTLAGKLWKLWLSVRQQKTSNDYSLRRIHFPKTFFLIYATLKSLKIPIGVYAFSKVDGCSKVMYSKKLLLHEIWDDFNEHKLMLNQHHLRWNWNPVTRTTYCVFVNVFVCSYFAFCLRLLRKKLLFVFLKDNIKLYWRHSHQGSSLVTAARKSENEDKQKPPEWQMSLRKDKTTIKTIKHNVTAEYPQRVRITSTENSCRWDECLATLNQSLCA